MVMNAMNNYEAEEGKRVILIDCSIVTLWLYLVNNPVDIVMQHMDY